MFLYLFISSRNYSVDSLALLHRHAVLCASLFTHVWLFATPRTVTLQAPLSIGILRQEYWSGLPCPPPENLPDPGIEPRSSALQADFCCLNHQGSWRILEWVAYSFSRGLPDPGIELGQLNSCIAGGFFTSWATREAPTQAYSSANTVLLLPSQSVNLIGFSCLIALATTSSVMWNRSKREGTLAL